jgi:hypothetical protein
MRKGKKYREEIREIQEKMIRKMDKLKIKNWCHVWNTTPIGVENI